MTPHVIGIDGGGGHTSACLLNAQTGAILATGEAGPSNIHGVGLAKGAQAIVKAARAALGRAGLSGPVDAICCCLSGAGRPDDQRAIREALIPRRLAKEIRVGHDGEATLAAGRVLGPGIAAIAGTGSLAWGRNGSGHEARADGWGSLLGDEGGGFRIGLEALRAVCRHHDGRGPSTSLLERALDHFSVDAAPQLIARLAQPTLPRRDIADFAPSVFRAAESMDPTALRIIDDAAASLVASAVAVRERLFSPEESVSVVLGGALMWKERLLQQCFSAAYTALCPDDPVLHPSISLALGAARLALETLGIRPNPAWGSFTPPKQVGVGALSQGEETGDGICLSPVSDDEAPSPANDTLARNRRIFEECRNLLTEQLHPEAKTLDRAEVGEILRLMNREDARVAPAVGKVLPQIAQAVEWVAETFRNGGRLFYAGAGTSGRLGCLDAAECPPTFGAPPHLVQALIAGGVETLLRSREGAEDLEEDAPRDLDARGFAARDILVGLAASSRTPYVLSALGHAHRAGARTALVTCNPPRTPLESVDLLIAPVVGPEVVMGSTRLKAATAQKMILNMLTTASMVRMGKVYDGMMVDLQMSCGKLAERAKRIVMMLTGLEYEQAADLLRASGGSVKTALVMHFRECSAREAARLLDENEGFVRRAIEGYATES